MFAQLILEKAHISWFETGKQTLNVVPWPASVV
jgi:hypothetical protein